MDLNTSKQQHDYSSTKESHSYSSEHSRSKPASLTGGSRDRWFDIRSPNHRSFRFVSASINNRKFNFPESNCEIVLESDAEQLEEPHKKLGKIKPILDQKEEMLIHSSSLKAIGPQNDRARSSDITLPKVIESKDEYSYIAVKPKYKVSNYLALIDRAERLNLQTPRTTEEVKEDQILDSKNAIEEVNQFEEELPFNDEDASECRSSSVRSGSVSRISMNSLMKRRIVDECVIFDREREMTEIVP